jgi:hypothetical protein
MTLSPAFDYSVDQIFPPVLNNDGSVRHYTVQQLKVDSRYSFINYST